MYGDFARVYDRLMAQVDYEAWGRHYHTLLSEQGLSDGAVVMEPACGTGSLTLQLARHYRMQPSDLSPQMLSVAMQKARQAGLNLAFTQQDLRSLRSHHPVDALVCGCDGVNYLVDEAALDAFLQGAAQVLKPGGALAFDVSSYDKLSRVLGSQPQVLRGEEICYIWENAWDEGKRLLSLSLSLFERDTQGRYLRIEEQQTQRAWTQEELTAALTRHGFEHIRCYANYTTKPPTKAAQRLHFSARKSTQ